MDNRILAGQFVMLIKSGASNDRIEDLLNDFERSIRRDCVVDSDEE